MRSAFLPPSIDLHFFQILLTFPKSGFDQLRLVVYPITDQVLYIPGGFLAGISEPLPVLTHCPQCQPNQPRSRFFVKAYGLHRGDEVLLDGECEVKRCQNMYICIVTCFKKGTIFRYPYIIYRYMIYVFT